MTRHDDNSESPEHRLDDDHEASDPAGGEPASRQGSTVDMVVFSDDWGRHPSSCQHLVTQWLANHRVLWVNTVGTRAPSLNWADMKRALGVIARWGRGRQDHSIHRETQQQQQQQQPRRPSPCQQSNHGASAAPVVISPAMYPGFRTRWQRRLNRALLTRSVNRAMGQTFGAQPPPTHSTAAHLAAARPRRVAITTLPITADLVGQIDVDAWIYYCVDDFSVWPGLDASVMQQMERQLAQSVDRAIAVSPMLTQRLAQWHVHAELLTHGIDLQHFAPAAAASLTPLPQTSTPSSPPPLQPAPSSPSPQNRQTSDPAQTAQTDQPADASQQPQAAQSAQHSQSAQSIPSAQTDQAQQSAESLPSAKPVQTTQSAQPVQSTPSAPTASPASPDSSDSPASPDSSAPSPPSLQPALSSSSPQAARASQPAQPVQPSPLSQSAEQRINWPEQSESSLPDWWSRLREPIYLFWGLVDARLDAAWCRALAQELEQLGRGCLVLAGPTQSPPAELDRWLERGVIAMPGPVAYEDLPRLAQAAAVLVMPYADLPVTRAMQPLKLKEYLATGRPTVVRDLPATRMWNDAADVVNQAEAFVQRVLERGDQGLPEAQRQARRNLEHETWHAKARQFLDVINQSVT